MNVNYEVVTNPNKLIKLTASPAFDSFRILSEDLATTCMKKTKLYLNRPIYVGFTILDLSKVLMYDFHYNFMVSKYGPQAKLLFTYTDSLCCDVKTDDLYHDILQDLNYFDTSEYPKRPLSVLCEEQKGAGEDERRDPWHTHRGICWLRSKIYSILFTEDSRQVEKKNSERHFKECDQEKNPTSRLQEFGFINGVDNVNWPPYRDSKS